MERSYLENNLISGVYTNKDKYLKRFTENWNKYYGNLPLIYNVREGKINENMEKLRHDFIQSGKRYWLFMDDDILFTRNDVIETALKHMQENDLSLVTTYQSTNYNLVEIADPSNLTFEFICWAAGYFMLIDSEKCGLVPFDLNLPTTHGSNSDIAYCLDIIEHNPDETLIGIAPTLIYHDDAGYSPKAAEPFKIDESNEQEVNKSVEEFFRKLDKKLLHNNPKIEIVFMNNGQIDYNETIGMHYLKTKHPDIFHEIIARKHYDRVHTTDGFSHHYFGQ